MTKKVVLLIILLSVVCLVGCSQSSNSEPVQDSPDTNDVSVPLDEAANDEPVEEHAGDEDSVAPEDSDIATFEVTSESLTEDGRWKTVIYSTRANPEGSDLSPQLSWSEVEGASLYAIYMIDRSANNWLHWIAPNVQETTLELGAELADSKYIGPYPPSGIHEYEINVYALQAAPDNYDGSFNRGNFFYDDIEAALDIADGKSGNMIAKGSISGTVTVGETVE